MSKFQSVAIIGGSGAIGKYLTREFLSEGSFKVKVLTRPDSKATDVLEELRQEGAEIVQVKYDDHEKLKSAFGGSQVVISAIGSYNMYENQERFIKAAKDAGVARFVPSEFGIDVDEVANSNPFFEPKVKTRKLLETSGMEYTYFITGFFIDYILAPMMGIDIKGQKASIIGKGESAISVTAMADISKFVVATINKPEAKNGKLFITGEDTTLLKIINDVATLKSIKFQVEHIPLEKAESSLELNSDQASKAVDILRIGIEKGDIFNKRNDASLVQGLAPMNIVKYVQKHM